ncbi:MAG: GAF domain-containing sensor histidine kinase [Chloroflexi bacterium]|nr:GAF domain-containing sensor histidine kinase [Chloroflexota bacterium]
MPQIKQKQLKIPTPAAAIDAKSFARLLEISRHLGSTLHLDDLLSLVLDVSTELTDSQKASILLVDKTTGKLHFAASLGGEVPKDVEVPLDNSIAGWVVQNNASLILGDVQADSRFYSEVDEDSEFVTRSMLAAPLATNTGTIGALEVLNKKNDAPYTPQDVALLEALASQAAVAIMNARLFQQSDLLAEIMHELKTPLMAISAASELLTRSELPESKRMDVTLMIKRETARLSKMTKDFVDFARLESGRVRLAADPVDIATVIHDVTHMTQSQADKRQITITADLAPDLPLLAGPAQLVGDADRLKQVLLNLVSNAIKYNFVGGRIILAAHPCERKLCLSVTDTGPGIAPEDMEHLFERFYRIPGSEDAEGSGLGLSIAHKIVEEHNGRIEVTSALGEGTTFTVFLPVTDSA